MSLQQPSAGLLAWCSGRAATSLSQWASIAERGGPVRLIVVAWVLAVVPLVFLRGLNGDSGLAVALAQGALEDGHWLIPHWYGHRFAERPVLLSWIIAAISWPFGRVGQETSLIPIALSVLAGALLVFSAARSVASRGAALLAAALFMACPLVLRSYATVIADLPLAVMLFAAFVLWWQHDARGGPTPLRWVLIGLVLGAAALLKGPQPVAYFAFGVGLFILITRSFRQIPGFVAAGIISAVPTVLWYAAVFTSSADFSDWARYMRLDRSLLAPLPPAPVALFRTVLETFPVALLASVFLIAGNWRQQLPPATRRFVLALICYAFTCSVVIILWPGGAAPRYLFPMIPALCVLGALSFDTVGPRRPLLVAPGLWIVCGTLIYVLVYATIAAPLMPEAFRPRALDGARVTEAIDRAPAPVYLPPPVALNVMPYVDADISAKWVEELATVQTPAWIILDTKRLDQVGKGVRGRAREVLRFGRNDENYLLRLD